MDCAIKLLKFEGADAKQKESLILDFNKETQVLKKISHPNLVQVREKYRKTLFQCAPMLTVLTLKLSRLVRIRQYIQF